MTTHTDTNTRLLAADEAYVQAKTAFGEASEHYHLCPLEPFRRLQAENTLTGEPSRSAFALFHYGLLELMNYHAYDTPAESVDTGEASLQGMVAAASIFMSHPSRDGWTSEQRTNYVRCMMVAVAAAHDVAKARIADAKGGAA